VGGSEKIGEHKKRGDSEKIGERKKQGGDSEKIGEHQNLLTVYIWQYNNQILQICYVYIICLVNQG